MTRQPITIEEAGGLRVSSHLEKGDDIIDIVGNKSGRRRVASGDEVQLHLVLGMLIETLEDVLGVSEKAEANEGDKKIMVRARELVEQIQAADN